MTKKEFDQIAEYLCATVVYKTSATAVFDGPRFCVTIEMTEDQLSKTNPTEVAHLMSTAAMLN